MTKIGYFFPLSLPDLSANSKTVQNRRKITILLTTCSRCGTGGARGFECPCGFRSCSDCSRSGRIYHRGNWPTWRRDPAQIIHDTDGKEEDGRSESVDCIPNFDFVSSSNLDLGLDHDRPLQGFLQYESSRAAKWLDSLYI